MFDNMCRMIEKYYPEFSGMLRHARLFSFDMPRPEESELTVPPEAFNGFYLPFKTTAINFKDSCYIFEDESESQTGIQGSRKIIGILDMGLNFASSEEGKESKDYFDSIGVKPFTVIIANYIGKSDGFDVKLLDHFSGDKKILFYSRNPDLVPVWKKFHEKETYLSMTDALMKNSLKMMGFIIQHITAPETFILETKTIQGPVSKLKKIPRAHQRPLYTILHPHKIREQMRLPHPGPTGTGKSKAPHERRRHERFLSDSKYKYDLSGRVIDPQEIPYGPRKGQPYFKKIDVPATWIGPTQSQVGNKIYRVILDK